MFLENLKESQEKWDCLTPEAGLTNGASSVCPHGMKSAQDRGRDFRLVTVF